MAEVLDADPVARTGDADADPRRWAMLAVVLVGTCMAILDASIVNVAIPAIRADLHASFGEVELVLAAYTLVYAVLLITGGRLGDLYGRKTLFIIGLGIFTAASALCGLAPSSQFLIGARALQGLGAALAFPQVMALIQTTFRGQELNRALGIFGCVIGASAIAGQIVGGTIISANILGLSWRPTFLVNVPVGIVGVVAAALVLRTVRPQGRASLDVGGVLLITLALVLLVLPLVYGREAEWPLWTLLALLACPFAFAVFLWYERGRTRRGAVPLLDVALFRLRPFSVGLGIAAAFFAANAGFLFMFALFLQVGRGFTPIQAGLTYVPAAAGLFVMSLVAPRLAPLLGRHTLSLGFGVAVFGYLAALALVWSNGDSLAGWELAPALLIIGMGQGLGITPLVGTVLGGIDRQVAGAAAGVLSTTLQVGSVLGVTLIGLLFLGWVGTGQGPVVYADAFARTLPATILLTGLAFMLVRLLRPPGIETGNALLEHLPSWASGLAYSLYLASGGHVGQGAFDEILAQTSERRLRRAAQAPEPLGDFLAFHFQQGMEDRAWFVFLTREALTTGDGPVTHEAERLPVIQRQVDEIRERQAKGIIPPELDPALVRLMAFALASYPRVFHQITRMTTGLSATDPEFIQAWSDFLRDLGARIAPDDRD